MGVGASGSNWDAAFVDSTQPIVDPAVTGNAGASWDAAYNIDNTGLSPASSSSSSSISASSSSSMSSSSIGQSTSTKRVQMTSSSGKEVRVEQPSRPVIQPLTPRPTLPPTTRAPLPPTTQAPPPTTRRPTTTTQATTPWDASFVNLSHYRGSRFLVADLIRIWLVEVFPLEVRTHSTSLINRIQ